MKGKGAQYNPANPFLQLSFATEHKEGIDEYTHEERPLTQYYSETPRRILSKNNSPDLKWDYSINPYQGCEHGCVYCYARNSHTYWGFSAGLDFESKIIVKRDVAQRLEREITENTWNVQPVMLSGNTDCYQPVERQLKLTRQVLEIMLKYRNPVSLITKNALVVRDLDLLEELASRSLVHVYFSLTTLDELLRSKMEPRTSTAVKKFEAMRRLSSRGIPVGVMVAPVIPGLNHHEIPDILRRAADSGACSAGYTVVRLNGQIADIFEDWLRKVYPARADKVLNQISDLHGGSLNDSNGSRRLKGDGNHAAIISQLFEQSRKKYFGDRRMPDYDFTQFRKGGNYNLFSDAKPDQ